MNGNKTTAYLPYEMQIKWYRDIYSTLTHAQNENKYLRFCLKKLEKKRGKLNQK